MTRTVAAVVAASVLALSGKVHAQAPPKKGTDMELDPDAQKKPEQKAEPEALPPVDKDAWGVGGTEEEGRFGPGGKKKAPEQPVEEKKPPEPPIDLGPAGHVGVDFVIGFGQMR